MHEEAAFAALSERDWRESWWKARRNRQSVHAAAQKMSWSKYLWRKFKEKILL